MDWDIEELFYRTTGKDSDQTDEAINNGDIDDAVFEKYEISFDTYCSIVKDLLPFTPKVQSGLTNQTFNAFVDHDENRAIVKGVKSNDN